MPKPVEIEKRPGWDWEVTYQIDGEVDVMAVFGCATIDVAIHEARQSFYEDAPVIILAARRTGEG